MRPIGYLMYRCQKAGSRARFLVPDLVEAYRNCKEEVTRMDIRRALKSIDAEALSGLKP